MAVVISFNGSKKTLQTVSALSKQVDHIHIVDNASEGDSKGLLKEVESHENISITWLGENVGLGKALNIGVCIAEEKGYKWLLTMDQDSVASENMIDIMRGAHNKCHNIKVLGANYHGQLVNDIGEVKEVGFLITSGNLVCMSIFDIIGKYNEALFIDCVDFDFSLRARNAGIKLYLVNNAYMKHELGDKKCSFPILGRFHTYHSPLRRYYIYRNFLYVVRSYALIFPGFIAKFIAVHVIYLVTIIIFGSQRLKSLVNIYYGIIGYFKGESGQYDKSN